MPEILSYSNPVARKEHRCDWCFEKIEKDTQYCKTANAYEGSVFTWKNHIHCEKIARELKMFDEYYEGVSEQDFTDYIIEKYNELVGENDLTQRNFSEQLDYLLNHFKITKNKL